MKITWNARFYEREHFTEFQIMSQISVYAKSPVLSGFGKLSLFADNLSECNVIIFRKSITK